MDKNKKSTKQLQGVFGHLLSHSSTSPLQNMVPQASPSPSPCSTFFHLFHLLLGLQDVLHTVDFFFAVNTKTFLRNGEGEGGEMKRAGPTFGLVA